MNNNRGNNNNNNRRRGRGNNRQQGGQQTNRIDSRARGNAPQMLEKYRKLAHDAHLNGDRVTEEYNLQFADHYFRVIADQKQRQDELRQPRREDRPSEYADDFGSDYDPYGETPSMPASHAERGPRSDQRSEQRPEYRPEPRPEREQPAVEAPSEVAQVSAEPSEGQLSMYEPVENPFVRDNRGPGRGLKQRKPRRTREEGGREDGPRDDSAREPENRDSTARKDSVEDRSEVGSQAPSTDFDTAVLPPAISSKPARRSASRPAAEAAPASAESAAEAPVEPAAEEKPRRRRTRKPAADDAGATAEAVNG